MSSSYKKLISFIFWVILLILAFSLPGLFSYQWWSILIGVLPFVIRLAYEHFDFINLFFNRTVMWLSNKEVAWEMKARFRGDFSNYDLDAIVKVIREKASSAKVLQHGNLEESISIPDLGIVLKIYLANVQQDESEFDTELVLAVQRIYVPFRRSTRTMNTLISTINSIRVKIDYEKEQYDFKAVFGETNPYLGLFLKRLKLTDKAHLNFDYRENEGSNQAKISILKDRVSIITQDLSSLQAFSKKYITLSSLNLSDA